MFFILMDITIVAVLTASLHVESLQQNAALIIIMAVLAIISVVLLLWYLDCSRTLLPRFKSPRFFEHLYAK